MKVKPPSDGSPDEQLAFVRRFLPEAMRAACEHYGGEEAALEAMEAVAVKIRAAINGERASVCSAVLFRLCYLILASGAHEEWTN